MTAWIAETFFQLAVREAGVGDERARAMEVILASFGIGLDFLKICRGLGQVGCGEKVANGGGEVENSDFFFSE
jgi:hypothetical protein